MSATKIATLIVYLVPIALTTFCTRLSAQETKSTTLFERVQSMPVTAAAENSKTLTIHGIVRQPDFTEAQAVVFCLSAGPSKATLLCKTTTDDRGHYSLSLSLSEEQSQHLMVFAIDSEDRIGWCEGVLHSSPRANMPLLLHESSGRIAGKLIAPRGEPVDGVPVKVWACFEPVERASGCLVDSEPFEFRTTSDANGDFVIEGLPASMHALVKIESDELDCLQLVIATSAGTPEVDRGWVQATSYFPGFAKIKLFPKHTLQGTVVDGQGNPIAGVHIGGQPHAGSEAVSDAQGRYTIRRLNPTELGPSVPKDYFEFISVEPPAESRFASTYFRLERQQFLKDTIKPIVLEGAWVSGRVLSATTKQPLAGIQIGEKRRDALQTSDADGRFQFSLVPGPHDIQFSPSWMRGTEATQFADDPKSRAVRLIDVFDGEAVDMGNIVLDINTDAAKPLTVRVVMADGSPVANCRLEFIKADASEGVGAATRFQSSLVQDEAIVEHVVTNEQGLATIKPATGWSEVDMLRGRPLPPNLPLRNRQQFSTNTLKASFPVESPRYFGSLEVPKEIPADVVELTLEEGAYLHGNLTLNGSPLEGVEVMARPLDMGQFQGSSAPTATTDAEGKYAIYAPQSDGYSLSSINDFPLPNWSLSLGEKRAQPVGASNEFEFPPIDLLAGNRNISGQVVDSASNPVEGANISCQTPAGEVMVGGYGRTNAEGKFSLVRLPQDSLTLEVKLGRPANRIRTSVVVEAQQTDVRIDLP